MIACSFSGSNPPPGVTGRKKSRCRTVWLSTKAAYSTSDASAVKTSWDSVNTGPGALVVKVGSTRQVVVSVATVAKAAPVLSWLKCVKVEAQRTEQQGKPDDAVTGDHHGGDDGVARERLGFLAARHHQRHDQRHLDDGQRDREHQGSSPRIGRTRLRSIGSVAWARSA